MFKQLNRIVVFQLSSSQLGNFYSFKRSSKCARSWEKKWYQRSNVAFTLMFKGYFYESSKHSTIFSFIIHRNRFWKPAFKLLFFGKVQGSVGINDRNLTIRRRLSRMTFFETFSRKINPRRKYREIDQARNSSTKNSIFIWFKMPKITENSRIPS